MLSTYGHSMLRQTASVARSAQPSASSAARTQLRNHAVRGYASAPQRAADRVTTGTTVPKEKREPNSSSGYALSAATAATLFGFAYYMWSRDRVKNEAPQALSLTRAPSPLAEPANGKRIDPATSQEFPIVLPQTSTPTGSREMRLVGVGVRTVSFLKVRVYSAALYVDAEVLKDLRNTPGFGTMTADGFMHADGVSSNHSTSEELFKSLMDRDGSVAIRIVPVRSTDYSHLRDGFTRSIQNRAKLARKAGYISPETDEALSHSLQTLKEAFPKASLNKGAALDLIFTKAPTEQGYDLTLEENGRVLGKVKSLEGGPEQGHYSVGPQLLFSYFADKDEISKPLKESVGQGFEQIVRA